MTDERGHEKKKKPEWIPEELKELNKTQNKMQDMKG
jgi:hypothetical protein